MQFDDAAHQREPDAEAVAPRSPDLGEHLEDAIEIGAGEAHAVVADDDLRLSCRGCQAHADPPARRSVANGVVQQVRHHLRQAFCVRVHPHGAARQVERQRVARALDVGAAALHGVSNDASQVDP
jgi:hypothetical protein